MIEFYVLDFNERLNINKNTETLEELKAKLKEEYEELVIALDSGNTEDIIEESLDLGQVNANIIDRYCDGKLSLEKQVNLHNMKLIGRKWEFKKTYEIRQI